MTYTTVQGDWDTYTQAGGSPIANYTTMSHAEFIAETGAQPFADHVDTASGIMRIIMTADGAHSGQFLRSLVGLALDHAAWRNYSFRWYVAPENVTAMADSAFWIEWLNIGETNTLRSDVMLFGTGKTANNGYGLGAFVDDFNDPTWLYSQSQITGTGLAGETIDRINIRTQSSARADATNPFVLYLFDIGFDAGVDSGPVNVAWSADDGTITQHSVMYENAKSSADNIPISLSVIPEAVDTGGAFLSTTQINEMYADNFDVVRHHQTTLGSAGTGIFPDMITKADIQDYIDTHSNPYHINYTKNGGDRVWVYASAVWRLDFADPDWPLSYFDYVLSDNNVQMGRKTSSEVNTYNTNGVYDPSQILNFQLGFDSAFNKNLCRNFTEYKAALDKAIEMGVGANFLCHEFVPSPSAGSHFLDTDWPLVTADLRLKADAEDINLYSLAQLGLLYGVYSVDLPTILSLYDDISNNVDDVVNVDLAPNWASPERLHFDIIQAPDSSDEITGLPGACSIQGELTSRHAYQTQVKATDIFSGLSTLSPAFTWSVERLAALGSVANQLALLNGPVIGVIPITAFDAPVTALASGTDLIPRKLYARATGDVVLIGLDGVEFTHTVIAAGIQDVGFVQINSVGTAGLITDYDGLL